ncbi:MAG: hypothetical protein HC880_13915 [Bacteroidia bacterium]|nr:hypothetical protein [Bacteroidia bacterium]
MKKQSFSLLFLFLSLLVFVAACTDESDPNGLALTQEERNLTQFTWKTEGFYTAGGQKLPTPVPRLDIAFQNNGLLRTISVNGQTIPASWAIANNTLQITYPSGFSQQTGLNISSQIINVNLSNIQLNILAPANDTLALFGLVSLPIGGSLRFNQTGVSVPLPETNNALTTGRWQSVGYYINDTLAQATNAFRLDFKNVWGINSVFVNSIPAPATWELGTGNNLLTFSYPTGTSTFASQALEYSIVNDTLRLEPQNQVDISLYGVINIQADQQLRFVNQQ